MRLGGSSSSDSTTRLVSAGPNDRLQLTDNRTLAGGTRITLYIPRDAPRGRWTAEVEFEFDRDGEPAGQPKHAGLRVLQADDYSEPPLMSRQLKHSSHRYPRKGNGVFLFRGLSMQ